jgi:hypothetical protein
MTTRHHVHAPGAPSILATMALIAIAAAVATAVAAAPLDGRHAIGLVAGVWDRNAATVTTDLTGADIESGTGAVGLEYAHWLSERWAVTLGARALVGAEVRASFLSGTTTSSVTVTSILLGARRYLPESTFAGRLRPFLAAGVGPCLGQQDGVTTGLETLIESRTETAIGAYLGGGATWILHRSVLFEVTTGYSAMTDFGQPVGGRDNYSGVQVGFGVSYVWGGGR